MFSGEIFLFFGQSTEIWYGKSCGECHEGGGGGGGLEKRYCPENFFLNLLGIGAPETNLPRAPEKFSATLFMRPLAAAALFKQICPQDKPYRKQVRSKHDIFAYTTAASLTNCHSPMEEIMNVFRRNEIYLLYFDLRQNIHNLSNIMLRIIIICLHDHFTCVQANIFCFVLL